ncbi:unnamed protein product [Debaryomyces tyrocola]|nr:unnamed protein product [Debaryomyces tyrocola]
MRLSTGFITAAYGAKVLAADATDYLGKLTDLYESYDAGAAKSIADLYQTDNSFLQQYQTIAEDLTNKPWYSDLAQVTDAAEASKITGELWFTSYENWASSVAGAGGFYNGGSGLGGSADSQESSSGFKSGSSSRSKSSSSGGSGSKSSGSGGSGSKSSGSGGSGSKSSGSGSSRSESSGSGGSGSESSGSGSGSSSSSDSGSGSGSSSSAGSDANIFYAPFGATLGALILALI